MFEYITLFCHFLLFPHPAQPLPFFLPPSCLSLSLLFFPLLIYSQCSSFSSIDPLRKQMVCLPVAEEEWSREDFSFIWLQLECVYMMTDTYWSWIVCTSILFNVSVYVCFSVLRISVCSWTYIFVSSFRFIPWKWGRFTFWRAIWGLILKA